MILFNSLNIEFYPMINNKELKKCIFAKMIKLFFGNRSHILFAIPVLVAFFQLLHFFFSPGNNGPEEFGYWGEIEMNSFTSYFLSGISIVFTALFVNHIFNRNDFMDRNNYMPSLLFVVNTSFFDSFYAFNGLSMGMIFFALMLYQLYRLKQNEDGRSILFNAYLFFGIATTFVPNLIVFLPLIIFIPFGIKSLSTKEILLSILAFFTPYVYLIGFYHYSIFELTDTLFKEFSSSTSLLDLSIITGINVLLTLLTMQNTARQGVSRGIRLQKLYRVTTLLIAGLIGVFIFAYLFNGQTGVAIIITVPLAMITSYAFGMKSLNKFPVIVLYITILLSVTKFFIPFNSISALL